MGYNGIVMTSWSTSGQYSPVFESENDISEEYAIRHVYPNSGFNMLIAAYAESIKSTRPLDIDDFIARYCKEQYGLDAADAAKFWKALKTTPYEILYGKVQSKSPMAVKQLLDSNAMAMEILAELHPTKNEQEFEHYRLMTAIREFYLEFHEILERLNSREFTGDQMPKVLSDLETLLKTQDTIDAQFNELNKDVLYPEELKEENDLRDLRVRLLYDRLKRIK